MGSPILALEPTAEGVGVQHHRKDGQSIASKAAPRGAAHYSGLFHESHIGSIYMVGGGNKADVSLLRERLGGLARFLPVGDCSIDSLAGTLD